MKFRKKPVEIEAMRFGYSLHQQRRVEKWVGDVWIDWLFDDDFKVLERPKIRTLEGNMIIGPGDWVIKGINGEFYPCKHDVFLKTYERVD